MTNTPLFKVLAVVALALCCSVSAAEDTRPNIVVIMADDMGYADLGAHGCTDIFTPGLDRLAQEGVVCTSGYVTHPFCGPSRAGFITGRYQARFGHEVNPAFDPANPNLGLSVDQTTFVKRLQDAGYHTGGVGKWHLGAAAPFHPLNRGFDYFYGFLGGGHDYFEINLTLPVYESYKAGLIRNEKPATFDGYLTDALSHDAVAFVERSAGKDEPFFLFVAYNAPHQPLQAPEEDIERHSHIEDPRRRTYAAMVHAMDRGIGQILDALEAQGVRDDTMVVFLSDNGGPEPRPDRAGGKGNGSDNKPLRAGKGSMYEGGSRVPFLVSWPARLPAGVHYDRPVIAIDIARTAVELAGADAGDALEGRNIVPFLTREREGDPHDVLFWRGHNGSRFALRSGDLKLVKPSWESDKVALFDLSADLGEKTDLASSRPDELQRLLDLWHAWNADNQRNDMLGTLPYHKRLGELYDSELMAE